MKSLLFYVSIIFCFTACTFEVPVKPGSNGKTCEIAVVCDKRDFDGMIGDTLRSFFMQESTMLNQAEPLFSLANISHTAFNNSDMFKHLRNTIVIYVGDTAGKQDFIIQKDLWATNQTVFTFNIASAQDFSAVFTSKKNLMLGVFYANERERIKRVFQSTENTNISEALRKKFGFKLICPEGFQIGVNKPDVICLIKDAKDYSQTIMIARYPYTANSFSFDHIIKQRNFLGENYVQGGIDTSYMTTEMRVPPISKEINFHGAYAVETKGLWRMRGDFMGGPFQNYVFLDDSSKNIIMVDAFLYSPRKAKRDLMMQLEGIVFSKTDTKISN